MKPALPFLPYVALVLSVLLLPGAPAHADDKPKEKPKLPLGKDTTYVVGPFDKEGYIDYESALNARLGQGVTAETNANVLLFAAFGPAPEGGDGLPPTFFKWLDIPMPPKDGDYFLALGGYARDRLALTQMQTDALYEFQGKAGKAPWSAKDFAPLAEWLNFNEKPMALVAEGVRRPHYFNPLASRRQEGDPSNLIGALLPSVQKCRELASAFTARAMLRLHEGKPDEAWQDLLACHRLGRHVSAGATLIESLVGIAIGAIAANSTLAYLEHAKLTPGQARARLEDLRRLPRLTPYAEKIDVGERFMGLDAVQNFRRGGADPDINAQLLGEERQLTAAERKAFETFDWAATLKSMNGWYDRMAAAVRVPDRVAREKALEKVEADLLARRKRIEDAGGLAKILVAEKPKLSVGEALGDALMGLLSPAVRKVQSAHDRAEQIDRNLHLALALAAHKGEHGRYPAKLDDLAPKYLPAVPDDLFSGKPLIYKPDEKGYVLYSVGPNGKDEGGRYYDDDPPGDDPRVRMPMQK
jgi:hypothetical protein